MLGNRLNQFYLYGYESRNKELDGAWEYIRLNTTSFDRWDFISRTALFVAQSSETTHPLSLHYLSVKACNV